MNHFPDRFAMNEPSVFFFYPFLLHLQIFWTIFPFQPNVDRLPESHQPLTVATSQSSGGGAAAAH